MCGEYSIPIFLIHCTKGSPPHTWRILKLLNQVKSKPNRITSTYVENTFLHKSQNMFLEDHLHIRGEYQMDSKVQKLRIGSPPHTWRIHKISRFLGLPLGITSTYVENTEVCVTGRIWRWDHLHIRGEYLIFSHL